MKKILFLFASTVCLFFQPGFIYSQAPNLGSAAGFVLFSSNGAVTNSGISHLTGHVGTNGGNSTAFGNVNGVMHDNDGASGICSTDLLAAYNQLNAIVPAFFPAPLLGNGQSLNAGVYSISGNASLNNTLTLNGQGNSGAVFIFQIQGAFATAAGSKVILINGALACNVFWKVEGSVSMASGTSMKGTVIANNAAIVMNSGVTLEGRALSTTGAISLNNVLAYTPSGCGSPVLTGPAAPSLGTTVCYALFTSNGPVSNTGVSKVVGDIGTNVGLTTGFNSLDVTGAIHPIPDGSTGACAADLLNVFNTLNVLPYDIELLYPAQFGNSLVLTPHTYLLGGAATFVDTLFLNAEGNANATFVIKINGALSTSTYAKVALMNGAQAKNIFWKIEGSVNINDNSEFVGTIIANNGAISLGTNVSLNGRALTTDGAFMTAAVNVTMTAGCTGSVSAPQILTQPVSHTACEGETVTYSVAASGNGLTYQWRRGSSNLTNGANVSGANGPVLSLVAVVAADAATDYNVLVGAPSVPTSTSSNAGLVISNCGPVGLNAYAGMSTNTVIFYPNPFINSLYIMSTESVDGVKKIVVYNILGINVLQMQLDGKGPLTVTELVPAIYFYKVFQNNKCIQSGKLVSQ
jgi:hypothetical protein